MRSGFFIRVGAAFIDGLLLGILTAAWMFVVFLFAGQAGVSLDFLSSCSRDGNCLLNLPPAKRIIVLSLAVPFLFYNLIEVLFAASPGKMLLGMQIRADNGEQAGMPVLFARFILKNVSTIGQLAAIATGLGFITIPCSLAGLALTLGTLMALGPNCQAMHDLALSTAVYYSSTIASESRPSERTEQILEEAAKRPRSRSVDELLFK